MDKNFEQTMWEMVVEVVEKLQGEDEIALFFNEMLTETERVMVAKRLMVLVLHLSGWNAVEISEELKMSRATVYKLVELMRARKGLVEMVGRLGMGKIERPEEGSGSSLGDRMRKLFER